ncbi:MAG: type II toxin-antitoxin system Phd/YefM family antitoxin [Candidatus Contendobacter sp.]
MNMIYADVTVSISELKKNPAHVLREAGNRPVAVLSHNKPAFYMVRPELFEALLDSVADQDLAELVASRLALKNEAVEVDIDHV